MRALFSICAFVMATTAQAEAPRVATDIAPVHGLVAQVMEGVGTPDLIIPPGASPHGYAMRPSEARALSQADVVFWVGPMLTPWMQAPIEALASDAQQVSLLDAPGVLRLEMRQGAKFEAHDHGDHGHDHADHEGETELVDPHLWLDPENASTWVQLIADRLSATDPENAARYQANAQAARRQISELRDDVSARLNQANPLPFIVFHDAYHYFEARFEAEAVASITLGDAGTASAARLAEVRRVVQKTGAACAFAELRANEGLINAVAENTDVKIIPLDAVGVDIDLGTGYYADS